MGILDRGQDVSPLPHLKSLSETDSEDPRPKTDDVDEPGLLGVAALKEEANQPTARRGVDSIHIQLFVVCDYGHSANAEKPTLSSLPALPAVHPISLTLSLSL